MCVCVRFKCAVLMSYFGLHNLHTFTLYMAVTYDQKDPRSKPLKSLCKSLPRAYVCFWCIVRSIVTLSQVALLNLAFSSTFTADEANLFFFWCWFVKSLGQAWLSWWWFKRFTNKQQQGWNGIQIVRRWFDQELIMNNWTTKQTKQQVQLHCR